MDLARLYDLSNEITNKVFEVTVIEFYFHTWTLYPDSCPTEILIKGLGKCVRIARLGFQHFFFF